MISYWHFPIHSFTSLTAAFSGGKTHILPEKSLTEIVFLVAVSHFLQCQLLLLGRYILKQEKGKEM